MKTITLRLSDEDHARLVIASADERMSMAAYLLRLFDAHVGYQRSVTKPKISAKEQAFLDYYKLIEALPPREQWTRKLFIDTTNVIRGLRYKGGNVSAAAMPYPQDMQEWYKQPPLDYVDPDIHLGVAFDDSINSPE